jgi:hypothetical protein
MSSDTENPYASPTATHDHVPQVGDTAAPVDWKSILWRWEVLRIPYNLIVGIAGLLSLALFPPIPWYELLAGVVLYGVGANACYLLGPAVELYINWFMDIWGRRLLSDKATKLIRSKWLTWSLFFVGSLFSVALTLFIGLLGALVGLGPID